MGRYVMIHQVEPLQSYTGPSGRKYWFHKGIPTKVTEKVDVAQFEKFPQRFKKVRWGSKKYRPCSEEEELGKWLKALKVSDAGVERSVHVYGSLENLKFQVKRSIKLDVDISEADVKKMSHAILNPSKSLDEKTNEEVEKRRKELMDKNRRWQIKKLKELGAHTIPSLEPDRVNMIMDLESKLPKSEEDKKMEDDAKDSEESKKEEESKEEEKGQESEGEESKESEPEKKEEAEDDSEEEPAESGEEKPEEPAAEEEEKPAEDAPKEESEEAEPEEEKKEESAPAE